MLELIKGSSFELAHILALLSFKEFNDALRVNGIIYSNEEYICELLPKVAAIELEGSGRRGEDEIACTLLRKHGIFHEVAELAVIVSLLIVTVNQLLDLLFGRQLGEKVLA